MSAMLPVLQTELRLTPSQLGLAGSLFLWVYGFLCPIAGQLADTYSKRLLVVLSLAVWSLVTASLGFATSAFMLLTLRAAMGVSESLYMPAAIALTANAYPPDRRSRAIAILTTAQIAGTVAGGWFGGWMSDRGQWRQAFFYLGAAGLLYALPYFLFLRGVKEDAPTETRKPATNLSVGALATVPSYHLLCVVFAIFCFGLWLIYFWLPTFLHEKFALDLAAAAFNATIYLQGAAFIGLLTGGILADLLYQRTKAARFWILTASFILCAPCLYFLGSSSTLESTRLAAAGFGLSAGLFQGNIFPATFEVVPANTRASAVGILNFCASILSGSATLAGGYFKESIGIARLMTYTALLYILAALLLIAGTQLFFHRDFKRNH